VKVGHCQAKSLKRTPVGVSPSGVSSFLRFEVVWIF
jgi:hypothetical protein